MSKKNKMFRAWIHNYPDGGERSAFEFGWRNGKKERQLLAAENALLAAENAAQKKALHLITNLAHPQNPEIFKAAMDALGLEASD